MADSQGCTAEIDTTWQKCYIPIKRKENKAIQEI